MKPERVIGVIMRAKAPGSYSVQRYDDESVVALSRREANLTTNIRLIVGDEIEFSVYRGGDGRLRAMDVTLLSPVGERKPIRKLPPYFALGPVIRVGVRLPDRPMYDD